MVSRCDARCASVTRDTDERVGPDLERTRFVVAV
jgi:hypothetical protein